VLSPRAPEGSFGHAGAGGSLGFADPSRHLAFGYVMNRMALFDHSRAHALVDAVYASL
jgi:CubicO group peptidase (beta-lactamase class C family)